MCRPTCTYLGLCRETQWKIIISSLLRLGSIPYNPFCSLHWTTNDYLQITNNENQNLWWKRDIRYIFIMLALSDRRKFLEIFFSSSLKRYFTSCTVTVFFWYGECLQIFYGLLTQGNLVYKVLIFFDDFFYSLQFQNKVMLQFLEHTFTDSWR